jgi:hypothetical protein
MKSKDLAAIIGVVVVSALFSFIVSSQLLIKPDTKKQFAEEVSAISADFVVPGKEQFNTDAINPTKLIKIVPNQNTKPFSNQ